MEFVLCLFLTFSVAIVLLIVTLYVKEEEKREEREERKDVFNDKTPYEVFLETYRGHLVDFFECGDDDTFHRWVRQHKKDLIQLVGVENYETKTIALSIQSALQDQGLTHPIRFFTGKEYRQTMAEEGYLVHIKDEDNVVLLFIGTQEELERAIEKEKNDELELNKKLGTIFEEDEE